MGLGGEGGNADFIFMGRGDFSETKIGSGQMGGRTQMGSDGFNRILTGFYFLGPVRARLVPSGSPKHVISRDFYRILTGF